MLNRIKSALDRRRRSKEASKSTSIEDLKRRAAALGFTYFTDYAAQPETKEREFRAGIGAVGVSVQGKTVLDIGPGLGDSLNAARKLGASRTFFIDSEPMFDRYLRLSGHEGWLKDYTAKPYFPHRLTGKIDLVWSKGSINCDTVNTSHSQPLSRSGLVHLVKRFDFLAWVKAMKTLLTPTGVILFMPAMGRRPTKIVDPEYDLDTYHWCEDVGAFKKSFFSQVLFDEGFLPVENVKYYNQRMSFPLGYVFYRDQKPNRSVLH